MSDEERKTVGEGILHPEGMQATMRSFFALPGLQEYWANRRTWFSKEFQREVDKMMSEETDRMDTAYERPPSA